jgi:acylphosphatase
LKRVRVVVSGRVQGVFFRGDCERMAVSYGLSGWVRNLPDGTVEAAFEGLDADVEAAVAWCRVGPAMAAVDDLVTVEESPTGEKGFRVR